MKLGLIAQIRDEVDIIETWLKHVDALFDCVYLVDHQSIDWTGEILKQAVAQRPGWHYYFLDIKTNLQAEVSTLLMHEAFKEDLHYLFFLDADEFIHVESREELEKLLTERPDPTIMADLHWKNCICQDLNEEKFLYLSSLYVPEIESNHKKIVIPGEIYAKFKEAIKITYGNHAASIENGNPIRSHRMGTILHVPIRSRKQAEKKVILSVISKISIKHRTLGQSTQFYEMLNRIAEGKLSDDDLRGFTLTYDKIFPGEPGISEAELLGQHYRISSFDDLHIANKDSLLLKPISSESLSSRQLANALNNLEVNISRYTKLKMENNIISIDDNCLEMPWHIKLKTKIKTKIKRVKNRLNK